MGGAVAADGGRDQRARSGSRRRRPSVLVAEILELATIAREHLGDRDRAAELLHQALGVDADARGGARALRRSLPRAPRLARPDRSLRVRARQRARGRRRRPTSSIRRLEEIAQLAELRLGDIPRAIEAWQRIAELEPGSPKVNEALRRLTARGKMWEQLVQSLEHEVARGRRSGHAHARRSRRWRRRIASVSSSRAARSSCTSRSSRRIPTTTRRSRRSPSSTRSEGDDAGLAQHAAPHARSRRAAARRADGARRQDRRCAEGVAGRQAQRAADHAAPARADLRDAARRCRRRGLRVQRGARAA